MDIKICHRRIKCGNIKNMHIINLYGLTIKNFIAIFYRRKSHRNATPRDKLNVTDFEKVQFFWHLGNKIWRLSRHHAMGMHNNCSRLIHRHCAQKSKTRTKNTNKLDKRNEQKPDGWPSDGWPTWWVTPKVRPKWAGTQWMGYPTQQSNNRKPFGEEASKKIWRPKKHQKNQSFQNQSKLANSPRSRRQNFLRRGQWFYMRPLRLAMPCWWVLIRTKQLSIAATLRVLCCAHAWRLGRTVEMCSVTMHSDGYHDIYLLSHVYSELDPHLLVHCQGRRPLLLAMQCWWVPKRTKQLSMAATPQEPCRAHAWRLGQTVEMCSVTIAFRRLLFICILGVRPSNWKGFFF